MQCTPSVPAALINEESSMIQTSRHALSALACAFAIAALLPTAHARPAPPARPTLPAPPARPSAPQIPPKPAKPVLVVCFFDQANYQGEGFCLQSESSTPWVGTAWNHRISSVKITAGYKLSLYELSNYGGKTVDLSADTPNLATAGFDNLAASFKATLTAPAP